MLNLVDIEKGLYEVECRKRRHFILFLFSTILIIVLDLVLMLTSKRNYVVELIFSILFSIIYLIYLVFYLTVIRRCLLSQLRFYEGAKRADLSEVECEIKSISKDIKEYNGLEYYILEAKVFESLKDEDKFFYVNRQFSFKEKQKATLYVYGSIVIKLEFRK